MRMTIKPIIGLAIADIAALSKNKKLNQPLSETDELKKLLSLLYNQDKGIATIFIV